MRGVDRGDSEKCGEQEKIRGLSVEWMVLEKEVKMVMPGEE